MKILYSPPKVIKNIFPKFIWNSHINKILLTFDDGPNYETTEIILQELEKHRIKTLFFCVGENIYKNPKVAELILKSGHTIGNHTHSHRKISLIPKSEIDKEINNCSAAIEDISGEKVKYFRPPNGRFDHRVNRTMNDHKLINVMWSLLTFDYKNDLNIVKFAVKNYLSENSIIVLHDNVKSRYIIREAISFIIDETVKRGFEFGEPSECLK